jgi:hypothetical protein
MRHGHSTLCACPLCSPLLTHNVLPRTVLTLDSSVMNSCVCRRDPCAVWVLLPIVPCCSGLLYQNDYFWSIAYTNFAVSTMTYTVVFVLPVHKTSFRTSMIISFYPSPLYGFDVFTRLPVFSRSRLFVAFLSSGARGWGTALRAVRSPVRYLTGSLKFVIGFILPAALSLLTEMSTRGISWGGLKAASP